MYNITMAADWTDEQLNRLVERRRYYGKTETELLDAIKAFTKQQWADDDYRWLGKELKEQVKYAQQNVKCCNMLLNYFNGKLASCDVSNDLEFVFLLCCAELEYGSLRQSE